jgi:hypothetical protein
VNADKKPRAAGGSQPEKPKATPQGRLYELLELSLGNQLVARAAVAHALGLAGRDELPERGPELLAFVRAHLVNILTGELGPRLTIALLDDLADELDPGAVDLSNELPRSSEPAPSTTPPFSGPREVLARVAVQQAPPSSKPTGARMRVLLVDPDRVGRTALARALVRAHSVVTVVDTIAELDGCFAGGETFDIAVIDAHHPSADALVSNLTSRLPLVAVVSRSGDAAATEALLVSRGVTRFEVRSRDAPAEELVVAMRRTLGTT